MKSNPIYSVSRVAIKMPKGRKANFLAKSLEAAGLRALIEMRRGLWELVLESPERHSVHAAQNTEKALADYEQRKQYNIHIAACFQVPLRYLGFNYPVDVEIPQHVRNAKC